MSSVYPISGEENRIPQAIRVGKNKRSLGDSKAGEPKRQALGNITNNEGARIPFSKKNHPSQDGLDEVYHTAKQLKHSEFSEQTENSKPVLNLDVIHRDDNQMVAEYSPCIFEQIRKLELKHSADPDYMVTVQDDISENMRSILVDWLVEVADEYGLNAETFFLAVNYIDRYLSLVNVKRAKLQLIGVTAMLIAAKYEEIYVPSVDEFVYITDNTYSREEILSMEKQILNVLSFNMTVATPKFFLRRYLFLAQADTKTVMMANLLLEIATLDINYCRWRPSHLALAVLRCSLFCLGRDTWSSTLHHHSPYALSELSACEEQIMQAFRRLPSGNLQAVREKYSHSKFLRVSLYPCPEGSPPHF